MDVVGTFVVDLVVIVVGFFVSVRFFVVTVVFTVVVLFGLKAATVFFTVDAMVEKTDVIADSVVFILETVSALVSSVTSVEVATKVDGFSFCGAKSLLLS